MQDTSSQQNTGTITLESAEALGLYNKLSGHNYPIPQDLLNKIVMMLHRVDGLIKSGNYKEFETIENYINWITKIPFGKYTGNEIDIKKNRAGAKC